MTHSAGPLIRNMIMLPQNAHQSVALLVGQPPKIHLIYFFLLCVGEQNKYIGAPQEELHFLQYQSFVVLPSLQITGTLYLVR